MPGRANGPRQSGWNGPANWPASGRRLRTARPPPAAPGGLRALPAPARSEELERENRRAVDADRRRRREEAVVEPPAPPPTLGEDLHARSLFALLPDDEDNGPTGQTEGEVS